MKMKLHHAATLALVGWYLMMPPLGGQPFTGIKVGPGAPLAHWIIKGTFTTEQECNAHRDTGPMGQFEQCVTNDDPCLKGK